MDLEQIKQALEKLDDPRLDTAIAYVEARDRVLVEAPEWLAALVAEVERLRTALWNIRAASGDPWVSREVDLAIGPDDQLVI